MAQVKENLLTQGLTGKVGTLVFRKRGNKTTVYVLTNERRTESEKLKDARRRFANAIRQARQALLDEAEYQRFKEMAAKEKKESAYGAAVAYFMKKQS